MTIKDLCAFLRDMNRCDAAQRVERYLESHPGQDGWLDDRGCSGSASSTIDYLFIWSETPEGEGYWSKLYGDIKQKEAIL